MAVVIPKQPRPERDQITVRLDRDLIQDLERYCRYLESSRDYVVGQSLAFIFRRDREFQSWISKEAARQNGHDPKGQAK